MSAWHTNRSLADKITVWFGSLMLGGMIGGGLVWGRIEQARQSLQKVQEQAAPLTVAARDLQTQMARQEAALFASTMHHPQAAADYQKAEAAIQQDVTTLTDLSRDLPALHPLVQQTQASVARVSDMGDLILLATKEGQHKQTPARLHIMADEVHDLKNITDEMVARSEGSLNAGVSNAAAGTLAVQNELALAVLFGLTLSGAAAWRLCRQAAPQTLAASSTVGKTLRLIEDTAVVEASVPEAASWKLSAAAGSPATVNSASQPAADSDAEEQVWANAA